MTRDPKVHPSARGGDNPRELLRQQAEVAAEALRAGGDVSREVVERLERLQRVAEAYDATHPPRRRRLPVAGAFVASLVLCTVLLFARRGEVDIRLDLAVAEATFVLRGEQKLTESAPLSTLGLSGMREIQLPPARNQGSRSLAPGGGAPPVRLAPASDGGQPASITLETMILPAGTRVRVRADAGQVLRLSVQQTDVEAQASVSGSIELAVAGEGTEQLDAASPQPLVFRLGPRDADLDLGLSGSAAGLFAVPLLADSLSFVRVDRAGEETRAIVRRTSAILSGSLYLESLNGLERKLRPGELLEVSASQGEITELSVAPDHLTIRYQGRVKGLSVGAGESRRSLMPTWLEWLKARRGAWLLWGTAVYLFGLVMGLLRWMGKVA